MPPTYDYQCSACGKKVVKVQAITDEPLRKCPKCSKLKLVRQISAGTNFILKGLKWESKEGY